MSQKIIFKYGKKTSLPTVKESGQVLFAIDESNNTGTIYFDTNNKRFQMGVDGGPYVPLAGGAMTGPLSATQLTVNRPDNDYPTINFIPKSRNPLNSSFIQTNTNGTFGFYSYHSDQDTDDDAGRYYTGYTLPGPTAGLNAENVTNGKGIVYEILTAKKAVTVAQGGTGQDMSTAPANALIRMSNAGTFWYTASANGAVYATSANGAITFGTLPVAQGGTGNTTFTSGQALIGNGTGAITTRAITNNTTTGPLNASGWGSTQTYATALPTMNTLAYWDGAYAGNNSNLTKLGTITKGVWNSTVIGTAYGGTGQDLSAAPANAIVRTSSAGTLWYTASAKGAVYATSANGAITFGTLPIAEGGTGSTTAAGARTALGITPANIGALPTTVQTSGYSATSGSNSTSAYFIYQQGTTNLNKMDLWADHTSFVKPVDIASGGTGVTTAKDLRNLVHNSYSDAGIANTVDVFTLAPGVYHLENTSSTDKNYPIAESRATVFVYGQFRAGTAAKEDGYPNGYWVIRILYGSGKEYINYRYWSTWKGWQQVHNGFNAVPVNKGGTGATTADGACTNLGAVKKSGDTMTGCLWANGGFAVKGNYNINILSDQAQGYYLQNAAGDTTVGGMKIDPTTNKVSFSQKMINQNAYERYYLPAPASLTSDKDYTILTTKSTVTVAQGGTGKTTLTSGQALIGNGTGAITTRAITDNTAVGALISSSSWTSNNSNLVTLNTLAFWNGAHAGNHSNLSKLATVTAGTWQATAIAVAYGGTGATSASGACTNLGAVKKSGDVMTGQLSTTRMVVAAEWPTYAFYHSTSSREYAFIQTATDGSFAFYTYGNGESKWTGYALPGPNTGLTANKKYDILTTKNTVTVAQGGTGATNMLGAQANLLTTDSSKITATTNLNTILQTGRFKMEGNASKTYNWPADANGARCLIIQEGALNNNTYGYWKQTAHMLGQNRTYSRNYHWDHWMEWKMDYNEETLVYSTSQPTNGYLGRIWLKPIS